MMDYLRIIFFFYVLFLPVLSVAQEDSVKMVLYTPEFEFTEGVYLSFEQVRNNAPIPKSRLITDVDYYSKDFFEQIVSNKYIFFYDQFGMKQQIKTSDIWGYCRNGIIYIAMEDNFYRITIIGSICHFVATVTTYDTRYYDPYYYNPYYFNYYNRYGGYPASSASNELRQYLLDFSTGGVMNYDVNNLQVLLMKDPELHDEYVQLRNKKKKQLKFLYIRKFNERNQLYIPVATN